MSDIFPLLPLPASPSTEVSLFCALDELSLMSQDVVFDVYFTSFCFTLLCLLSVICTSICLGFFPVFEALLERSLALYFRH